MSETPCCGKLCEIAQTKFAEMDLRWRAQLDSMATAIKKSEDLLSIRLEDMNNFRKQIETERREFATRRETILINFVVAIIVVIIGAFITHRILK